MKSLPSLPVRRIWKRATSPTAEFFPELPASSSLFLRPHAFLNQLLHFNRPRLILRNAGFALCRQTEFGIFFRSAGPGGEAILVDPVSGLEINGAEITGIYWFHESGMPPAFEIQFGQSGAALAIQPTSTRESRTVMGRILNSFQDRETGPPCSADSAAAGTWLDELTDSPADSGISREKAETSLQQNADGSIRIVSFGAGFSFDGTLVPLRFDRDAGILRFWDRKRRTVVYTDTANSRVAICRALEIEARHSR